MQTSITTKELADLSDVTILDVRRKPAYDDDTVVIAGATLRDLGIDARYLEDGIEDWKATGGRLAPKP